MIRYLVSEMKMFCVPLIHSFSCDSRHNSYISLKSYVTLSPFILRSFSLYHILSDNTISPLCNYGISIL